MQKHPCYPGAPRPDLKKISLKETFLKEKYDKSLIKKLFFNFNMFFTKFLNFNLSQPNRRTNFDSSPYQKFFDVFGMKIYSL